MSRGKPSKFGRLRRKGFNRSPSGPAPTAPDTAPGPVPERLGRSHVNVDGTPKRVMSQAEATAKAKQFGMVAYLCNQAPEHYHIGKTEG
jgi:hypothetical protein